MHAKSIAAIAAGLLGLAQGAAAQPPRGYYRQPDIHGDTIVFVAESDVWRVSAAGGVARRLTTHPSEETEPAIGPDGKSIAFIGRYEGPTEIYTMPLDGGLPTRRTYGTDTARFVGWTPDGDVLYATDVYATLPNYELVRLDVARHDVASTPLRVPLAQAADGSYDATGQTLFFTRLPFQGSHTKRYQGGTAQNIWRFAAGDDEATPLTADFPGTSKRPMWWNGRVYFATDRDETMNLWSMDERGGDLRQHTHHVGWDVKGPRLQGGRIVYQLGADLHVYDVATDRERTVDIRLASDLDQTREKWVEPMDFLTAAHPSPDGDRVVLTARGRVFVAPHRQGRLVDATRVEGVRHRAARFMPDGESLVVLADTTGEVEVWTTPANGVGAAVQHTKDAVKLRWEALPSPDGKRFAHHDKDQRLFVHDIETGVDTLVEQSTIDAITDLAWSPGGRWLAYVAPAENMFRRIRLYDVETKRIVDATSDRFGSFSPTWSADGQWLYFLSNRHLRTVVGSPWGPYAPQPFLDDQTQIYQLALREGLRSPFRPADELLLEDEEAAENDEAGDAEDAADGEGETDDADDADDAEDADDADHAEDADNADENDEADEDREAIDVDGFAERIEVLPVGPGNYRGLAAGADSLYWLSAPTGEQARLVGMKIAPIDVEVKTVLEDVRSAELTLDRKTILVRKGNALHLIAAKPAKADLAKTRVDLAGWRLSVQPREEWRQMFVESWRLERDYFYDRDMHGVDWNAMLMKHLPLVERVTTREELADLMAQMVAELAALHTFVRAGDVRGGTDTIAPASLGAVLRRDEAAGGYRVDRVYRTDPDEPQYLSPLARPGVQIAAGAVIRSVNGTPALDAVHVGALLRNQAGRQVLLDVVDADAAEPRKVIVEPISLRSADDLRYREWEYTRRLAVESAGEGELGYVHLRAMGGRDYTSWARDYFPVFNRKGLVIDVRHNRGGNIDSWILGSLLRRAWFDWSQHSGDQPLWNMQYAFRGHVVVLCNERTASDGEAFAEGIKRLELGTLMGTRTWGGEIWLSSSNTLVDRGIATAAEYGVYGPEGAWLIEGWGVEPDVVIDNLPHATFNGEDAQLDAAIRHLLERIEAEPIADPGPPPGPDKSSQDNGK